MIVDNKQQLDFGVRSPASPTRCTRRFAEDIAGARECAKSVRGPAVFSLNLLSASSSEPKRE
jgi:hypothetical protein